MSRFTACVLTPRRIGGWLLSTPAGNPHPLDATECLVGSRRIPGPTKVVARNERYIVALGPEEEDLRGEARRDKSGVWTVSKMQWVNANGAGQIAGFSGGPMVIGIIPNGVSKELQRRLVRAMLGLL